MSNRSYVQSPKFKSPKSTGSPVFVSKLAAAQFRAFQVTHHSGNRSAGFDGKIFHLLKLWLHNVSLVQSHVELRSHLATRTFRVREKLSEFFVASPLEAFRDVG